MLLVLPFILFVLLVLFPLLLFFMFQAGANSELVHRFQQRVGPSVGRCQGNGPGPLLSLREGERE